MPLTARSVVVVGANRGIGLGFVRQLLQLPTPPEVIIATYRNLETAKELRDIAEHNASVKLVKLDVESDELIDSATKETASLVGECGLNLLIANAGIAGKVGPEPEVPVPERGTIPEAEWQTLFITNHLRGSVEHQTRKAMQHHFNVNTTGPLMVVQRFLPLLRNSASLEPTKSLSCSRSGVVFISSSGGSQHTSSEGRGGHAYHYKCSKTALNMMSILLSRQLKQDGVFVVSMNPGWTRTDMGSHHAWLSVEESVSGCLQAIGDFGDQDTGKFINYDGKEIPW